MIYCVLRAQTRVTRSLSLVGTPERVDVDRSSPRKSLLGMGDGGPDLLTSGLFLSWTDSGVCNCHLKPEGRTVSEKGVTPHPTGVWEGVSWVRRDVGDDPQTDSTLGSYPTVRLLTTRRTGGDHQCTTDFPTDRVRGQSSTGVEPVTRPVWRGPFVSVFVR